VKNRLGVSVDHDHYRWWALSCTSLGMLLAATNSGTLIIALPDLERALKTSILSLVWVILAYMIASTVLVLSAGRLSDLFGRKRAYVGGFVVFALANRNAALVTDAFPKEELGLARGTNTMAARSWRSAGSGSSGSTCPSRSPARSGAAWSCTSWRAPTACAASTSPGC
jgi:MFS family permease